MSAPTTATDTTNPVPTTQGHQPKGAGEVVKDLLFPYSDSPVDEAANIANKPFLTNLTEGPAEVLDHVKSAIGLGHHRPAGKPANNPAGTGAPPVSGTGAAPV